VNKDRIIIANPAGATSSLASKIRKEMERMGKNLPNCINAQDDPGAMTGKAPPGDPPAGSFTAPLS
jgi:hypothetical protein